MVLLQISKWMGSERDQVSCSVSTFYSNLMYRRVDNGRQRKYEHLMTLCIDLCLM